MQKYDIWEAFVPGIYYNQREAEENLCRSYSLMGECTTENENIFQLNNLSRFADLLYAKIQKSFNFN